MKTHNEAAVKAARRNIEIWAAPEWQFSKPHPARRALDAELEQNAKVIAAAGYSSGLDLLAEIEEETKHHDHHEQRQQSPPLVELQRRQLRHRHGRSPTLRFGTPPTRGPSQSRSERPPG